MCPLGRAIGARPGGWSERAARRRCDVNGLAFAAVDEALDVLAKPVAAAQGAKVQRLFWCEAHSGVDGADAFCRFSS